MADADKVLVVGCGGIGCELLKLLSREKIGSVTMIDCDTVELSNLNRQFFFTRNDVGKSKAVVAARIFARMCENRCTVHPICMRIEEFDACFFAGFDIVYCCLDNVAARVYVNQRCVFSSTRMVDGGSGGFKGQAYYFDDAVSNGSRYECFDCIPRGSAKEHAVCTIRSRPSCFEHCIIWAKHVFLSMKIVVHGDREEYYYANLKSIVENCECTHDALDLDQFRSSEEYTYRVRHVMKTISAMGVPEFNKDDRSVLELVYNVAFIRARVAGIEPISFEDAVTVAGSIIPSISTANSIIASLMILSAGSKCNYYLVNNGSIIRRMERCVSREGCLTCSLKWYVLFYSHNVTFTSLMACFRAKSMELLAFTDADSFLTPSMKEAHGKEIRLKSNSTAEAVYSRKSATRRIGLYIMKHDGCMALRRMNPKVFMPVNNRSDR